MVNFNLIYKFIMIYLKRIISMKIINKKLQVSNQKIKKNKKLSSKIFNGHNFIILKGRNLTNK